MDCIEIRQGFSAGGVPSGVSVADHVRVCPHCRELLEHGAALGRRLASATPDVQRLSSAQLAATEALIENEHGLRAYLRSRSTRVRWLLSLALPALFLTRELLRRPVPWRDLSTPRILAGVALIGFLGVLANSALRPLPIERHAARLRSALALGAWCLPCVLWFAPEARASADEFTGSFGWRSLSCFAYGSALAAPSFALLWAFDRDVRVPFRVWASAAGMVGIVANLILMLHCPLTNRAHLLAGHLSIGLAWFIAVSTAEWWLRRVEQV
ncbi:MAG: hypothetical protein ABI548_13045 [Polyangiaceae bacterium]